MDIESYVAGFQKINHCEKNHAELNRYWLNGFSLLAENVSFKRTEMSAFPHIHNAGYHEFSIYRETLNQMLTRVNNKEDITFLDLVLNERYFLDVGVNPKNNKLIMRRPTDEKVNLSLPIVHLRKILTGKEILKRLNSGEDVVRPWQIEDPTLLVEAYGIFEDLINHAKI